MLAFGIYLLLLEHYGKPLVKRTFALCEEEEFNLSITEARGSLGRATASKESVQYRFTRFLKFVIDFVNEFSPGSTCQEDAPQGDNPESDASDHESDTSMN